MVRDVMDLDVYGRERAALPGPWCGTTWDEGRWLSLSRWCAVCLCCCAAVRSRVPASVRVSPVPRALFAFGRLIVVDFT